MADNDNIERQRAHFDAISEKYFLARKNKNHLLIKKLIWEYFFQRNPFPSEVTNVLEPMCGYGEGKSILEEYGHLQINYTGFDYSQALINIVKKDAPNLNIYQQDVTKFDAQNLNEKYSVIILIGGLHHVFDRAETVIRKLTPALTPQGFFISLEPTYNLFIHKRIRDYIYRKNSLFDQETEQAFELGCLNNMFAENGYKLVDQIYPGLISYILYYNPDAFPNLNIGGRRTIKSLFSLDKLFLDNFIGYKFSFATLSLYKKES